MFPLKQFIPPDFNLEKYKNAPDAVFSAVPADGVAPDNFHAMSIFPEYFKIDGKWILAEESRMDCVAVLRDGLIDICEPRRLKKGDLVATGRTENGEDGILVWPYGFDEGNIHRDVFAFRGGHSRETASSKEYKDLSQLLRYEREHGKIVWVMGPAAAFDRDARNAMSFFIANGYAHAIMAGNALATHDLEAAWLGTALGQDVYTRESMPNGHYNHLTLINAVRKYGSIAAFIENENIDNGIIYSCEKYHVPYVLAGSIRDDGPLPPVTGNVYEAQDAMREQIRNATTVICMATALHSIATGNMTPSFRVMPDGSVRQIYFYCVDSEEFLINKLSDRGSLSSRGIVTNVQDFLVKLQHNLQAAI